MFDKPNHEKLTNMKDGQHAMTWDPQMTIPKHFSSYTGKPSTDLIGWGLNHGKK
jgi:hypothetical protein